MPSPGNNNDELTAGLSEKTLSQGLLSPEKPLGDEKIEIEQPQDRGTKIPVDRRGVWIESCQSVIEKCDVWAAILKMPP